jgi:hypothetical protein
MATSLSPASVLLPLPVVGVCQAAALLELAVRTCPALGVPLKLTPFTLATVGLVAAPPRSPPICTLFAKSLLRFVTSLSVRVAFCHLLVAPL